MTETKITSDTILDWCREMVESKKMPSREMWLDIAFRLNLLVIDEKQLLNKMNRSVAMKKLEIMKSQDKRNVSAADLEVEASEEYLFMKDQEAKVDAIEEFVRIAKRNSDVSY